MKTPAGLTLLVGGARSGKSDLAVRLAEAWGGPVTFVATARTDDDADFTERIDRHRATRPASWTTVEAPLEPATAVTSAEPNHLIIVDCLSVWVSNLMFEGLTEAEAPAAADALADALQARETPSIVVTNEVGLGVHPSTTLGREYRDVLGRTNRHVAARSDRAVFVAVGRVALLADAEELFR